jgi:hypothetical protein
LGHELHIRSKTVPLDNQRSDLAVQFALIIEFDNQGVNLFFRLLLTASPTILPPLAEIL